MQIPWTTQLIPRPLFIPHLEAFSKTTFTLRQADIPNILKLYISGNCLATRMNCIMTGTENIIMLKLYFVE